MAQCAPKYALVCILFILLFNFCLGESPQILSQGYSSYRTYQLTAAKKHNLSKIPGSAFDAVPPSVKCRSAAPVLNQFEQKYRYRMNH